MYRYSNSKSMDQPGKVANPTHGHLNCIYMYMIMRHVLTFRRLFLLSSFIQCTSGYVPGGKHGATEHAQQRGEHAKQEEKETTNIQPLAKNLIAG